MNWRPRTSLLCMKDHPQILYRYKTFHSSSMDEIASTGLPWILMEDFPKVFYEYETIYGVSIPEDCLQATVYRSSMDRRPPTSLLCIKDHPQTLEPFWRSSIIRRSSKKSSMIRSLSTGYLYQKTMYRSSMDWRPSVALLWTEDVYRSSTYRGLSTGLLLTEDFY